jgi:hypothetical protein
MPSRHVPVARGEEWRADEAGAWCVVRRPRCARSWPMVSREPPRRTSHLLLRHRHRRKTHPAHLPLAEESVD